jgi:hypothetical protein
MLGNSTDTNLIVRLCRVDDDEVRTSRPSRSRPSRPDDGLAMFNGTVLGPGVAVTLLSVLGDELEEDGIEAGEGAEGRGGMSEVALNWIDATLRKKCRNTKL